MSLHKTLSTVLAAVVLATTMPVMAQHTAVHAAAGDHAAAPIKLGDIEISGAFTRATLPNAPVGGGFLTITNTGTSDDRLIAVAADFAAAAQMHEMKVEDGVMKMRQLKDGIPVPAAATVVLSPGGLHLMFMQLTAPLLEGTTVSVTLTFETAGTVDVELPVADTAADAPMAMHTMDHN